MGMYDTAQHLIILENDIGRMPLSFDTAKCHQFAFYHLLKKRNIDLLTETWKEFKNTEKSKSLFQSLAIHDYHSDFPYHSNFLIEFQRGWKAGYYYLLNNCAFSNNAYNLTTYCPELLTDELVLHTLNMFLLTEPHKINSDVFEHIEKFIFDAKNLNFYKYKLVIHLHNYPEKDTIQKLAQYQINPSALFLDYVSHINNNEKFFVFKTLLNLSDIYFIQKEKQKFIKSFFLAFKQKDKTLFPLLEKSAALVQDNTGIMLFEGMLDMNKSFKDEKWSGVFEKMLLSYQNKGLGNSKTKVL